MLDDALLFDPLFDAPEAPPPEPPSGALDVLVVAGLAPPFAVAVLNTEFEPLEPLLGSAPVEPVPPAPTVTV